MECQCQIVISKFYTSKLLILNMKNRISKLLLPLFTLSFLTFCTPQSPSPHPPSPSPSILDTELASANSIQLSYDHINSFSFKLTHVEDFMIGVDVDQTIKGNIKIYAEDDGTFYQNSDYPGEETRVMIYEDRMATVVNEVFFHSKGFMFLAKKGHQYIVRLVKNGKDKLAVVNMENYLTEGETAWNLGAEHIGTHQNKTNKIKEELKGILSIVERNAVINEQIANHVKESTKRYMFYQVLETVLVVIASIGQVGLIKKLLTDNSII